MRSGRATAFMTMVLVGGGALAGCSGSSSSTSASTTTTSTASSSATGSATVDPAVAWAGGVCSAADAFDASVQAIGSSLKVDLTASSGAMDQVRSQLKTQSEAAATAAANLGTAITTVPSGASPEVSAAVSQLTASKQALQTALDSLKSSISTLQGASDVKTFTKDLAGVAAQFGVTKAATTTFATSLKAADATGSAAVKNAFTQAPQCKARLSK